MKATKKIQRIRDKHSRILKFLAGDRCRCWIRTDIRNQLIGDIKLLQDYLDQLEKQLQEETNDSTSP